MSINLNWENRNKPAPTDAEREATQAMLRAERIATLKKLASTTKSASARARYEAELATIEQGDTK